MPVAQTNIIALVRADLGEEAAAGFPRLKRVPDTDIIWFLDYFIALDLAEQQALLDALSRWSAMAFFPKKCGPQEVQELEEQHPAFARLRAARNRPGAKGGTRYTGLKMLCMDPSVREPGGYHQNWRENFTALHFQPRADLLPDLSHLKAAKAPLLRKLVNAAMTKLLQPKKEKLAGGACKYVAPYGTSELTVQVDFGSTLGQLRYEVSLKNAAYQFPVSRLCYERFWDANLGWDYLTEENAARSIDFLAEQVVYLAKFQERVNGLTNGCS